MFCIKLKEIEVKSMRKEAGREEWKKLYDVATRIRELKPWEDFWDLDLICLRMQPLSAFLEKAENIMGLLYMRGTGISIRL